MSVQSLSFWQQDATYWNRAQQRDQSIANTDSLINALGSIVTNESSGLSSIANQTALNRVNTALTAAIQAELKGTSSGSSTTSSSSPTSSSGSSSASSSSTSSSSGAPATAVSTIPLLPNTSLLTLGIPKGGSITVSAGSNITTYKSTGKDNVTDLLTALNTNAFGNAQVNAYLNSSGNLVISGKNDTDSIAVGGLFASNIGFGAGHQTFKPTPPSAPASSSSATSSNSTGSTASSTASASGSSTSSRSNPITAGLFNSAAALQTGATAEFLLGSTGSTGSVVNLLA